MSRSALALFVVLLLAGPSGPAVFAQESVQARRDRQSIARLNARVKGLEARVTEIEGLLETQTDLIRRLQELLGEESEEQASEPKSEPKPETAKPPAEHSPAEEATALLKRGIDRLQQRRDHVGAVADLTRAIALRPDLSAAFFYRAAARAEQGRLQEALADLKRAEALGSQGAFSTCDIYMIRGHCLFGRDPAGALAAYQRYLELAPAGTQARAKVQQRVDELEAARDKR